MQMVIERNGGGAGKSASGARARINPGESPLRWLHARGLLSARQLIAGEALRSDYSRAGLAQRVTMLWNAAPLSKTARRAAVHGAATLAQIDAHTRFDAAVGAAGTGLSDIVWRVVCAGESVPFAEKMLGWPTRAGRLVLALALDRIADYYRIK